MTDLFHFRQLFFLGAYESLVNTPLPSKDSDDYTPALLYVVKAHLALGSDPTSLLKDQQLLPIKAAAALAAYLKSSDDSTLEQLRDITIEAEAGEDALLKDSVKALAGTALVRARETEEAIDTLGVDSHDLEVILILTHIYLSLSRPDLAIKLFLSANKHSQDDLLLQLIESTISLYSPSPSLSKNNNFSYRNAEAYYTEQLANPSLSSPLLLKARGVSRILLGNFQAAKSDLEEALSLTPLDPEAKAAYLVATSLAGENADDQWAQLQSSSPDHPMVSDLAQKSALFDQLQSNWTRPPLTSTIS